MDPLIEGYISETFHPDKCDIIKLAFDVFEQFEYPDFQTAYIDLIMTEDEYNPQSVQDHFTTLIHEQLDFVLGTHLLKLNEFTPLWEKVVICEGLLNLQNLKDYSGIIYALESLMDNEEKIAEVLGQCSQLTTYGILPYIERIDSTTIDHLKEFIYNKERNEGIVITSQSELTKKIINNLRLFKQFLQGKKHCLGLFLLDHNVLVGQPLERYVPFVEQRLRTNDYEQLSLDIFSLILLTDEGFNTPIFHFRKNTGLLLDDLHAITRIDSIILGIANEFDKFKNNLRIQEMNQNEQN